MPLYEYRCSSCDNVYEELVSGDRNKKVPCPSCGSDASEKLISVVSSITMSGAADTPCGSACSSASSCATDGGCCPHLH
ncbi:MAG: zinc ribbon domain-containing protein [Chitinispirillaceae bacterium]|nr:zinc ribbon domain-containing protein [Chitinispirillaceae bacterium]